MMPGVHRPSFPRRGPACRAGFTLTEMLVALAVMVLVLAMVTSVFSITTKTAATSAAIADVEAITRNFADQLQQDLEECDPSQSVLVIHGRTQPAGLTEDLRQAGQYYRVMVGDPLYVPASYDTRFDPSPLNPGGTAPRDQFSDPRADVLMFFTNHPTASKAPAIAPQAGNYFQWSLFRGTRVAPVQVVYGHAALDTAVQSGGDWQFADNLRHIEEVGPNGLSQLPANRWHLARRQVLFDDQLTAPYQTFLAGDWDRITRCHDDNVPAIAKDSVSFQFDRYIREFLPRRDGRTELALLSPYGLALDGSYGTYPPAGLRWSNSWDQGGLILNVLYHSGNSANHHLATVIEHPPADLQDNLGVHLVPGCVWFQVELLLPEDPRNGRDHPLSDQRRDTPRWVAVEDGQTYVFVPDTPGNRELVEQQTVPAATPPDTPISGSRLDSFAQVVPPIAPYGGQNALRNREIRMWPYGIRITIRAIDQRGRLEEPIARTVVHRFD